MKAVKCMKCGTVFPDEVAVCPVCGTLYVPEEARVDKTPVDEPMVEETTEEEPVVEENKQPSIEELEAKIAQLENKIVEQNAGGSEKSGNGCLVAILVIIGVVILDLLFGGFIVGFIDGFIRGYNGY